MDPPSWISPLPDPVDIPETNRVAVHDQTFPFLTAFLSRTRKVDVPFPQRYGLARFLLSCAERACHAWVRRWHPLHLELLSIREADDLELAWWLLLVKHLSVIGQQTHPPEASATRSKWCSEDVGQIRHIAVHRQEYDTRVIRHVVNLAVNTNDSQLVSDIEQVLESLYIDECDSAAYHLDWLFQEEPHNQPDRLSEDAKVALNTTLGLLPTTPGTPHQVLGRLECILNNVCFNYALSRNDLSRQGFRYALFRNKFCKRRQLTEPFEGELDRWWSRPYFDKYENGEFASEFEICVRVRNSLEHKHGYYTDLEWLADTLGDSKRFAAALEDFEAVEAIEELENLAFPSIEAQCAAITLAFSERSEGELRQLAKQCYKKWDHEYQLKGDDYEEKIARRFEESRRWYEAAADRRRLVTENPPPWWQQIPHRRHSRTKA